MTLWNADPERFRFARDTSFGRRHMQLWSNSPVLLWIVSTECGFFLKNFPLWNNKVGYEDNITETLHNLYWTQDTVDHGFTIGMSDMISILIHCSLYFSGHRSSFFIWHSFFVFFLVPLYQVCFFRQFLGSVTKVDYMTLRHGFITVSYQAYILEVLNYAVFTLTRHSRYRSYNVMVFSFRHIWPLEAKQDLTSKSTSADHLMRILKLWWGSGLFLQAFEAVNYPGWLFILEY